jgi:hypothetical protein
VNERTIHGGTVKGWYTSPLSLWLYVPPPLFLHISCYSTSTILVTLQSKVKHCRRKVILFILHTNPFQPLYLLVTYTLISIRLGLSTDAVSLAIFILGSVIVFVIQIHLAKVRDPSPLHKRLDGARHHPTTTTTS